MTEMVTPEKTTVANDFHIEKDVYVYFYLRNRFCAYRVACNS